MNSIWSSIICVLAPAIQMYKKEMKNKGLKKKKRFRIEDAERGFAYRMA